MKQTVKVIFARRCGAGADVTSLWRGIVTALFVFMGLTASSQTLLKLEEGRVSESDLKAMYSIAQSAKGLTLNNLTVQRNESAERKLIVVNPESLDNVVLSMPESIKVTPLLLAELRNAGLDYSDNYDCIVADVTNSGVYDCLGVSNVAVSDDVVLPTFRYGEKGNVKTATQSERIIKSVCLNVPTPIFSDNASEEERNEAYEKNRQMALENGCFTYQYVLPNGDLTTYTDFSGFKRSANMMSQDVSNAVTSQSPEISVVDWVGTINYTYHVEAPSSSAKQSILEGANKWNSILSIKSPVIVWAGFSSDFYSGSSSTLGSSFSPETYTVSSTGIAYPAALIDQIFERDMHPSTEYDILILYNKNFSFYYGSDGNCPNNQHDFQSIVTHELCHGLGFSSYHYRGSDNKSPDGSWSTADNVPSIFDTFLYYSSGRLPSLSQSARKAAFTSNALYWDGANAKDANGGNRIRMFAPSSYKDGSSVSHWDDSVTFETFMKKSISAGEVHHEIDARLIGAFEDMGWIMKGDGGSLPFIPSAPTVSISGLTLSWEPVSGAKYYKVYYMDSQYGFVAGYSTWMPNCSCTITAPTQPGNRYYLVRASSTDSGIGAGDYSNMILVSYAALGDRVARTVPLSGGEYTVYSASKYYQIGRQVVYNQYCTSSDVSCTITHGSNSRTLTLSTSWTINESSSTFLPSTLSAKVNFPANTSRFPRTWALRDWYTYNGQSGYLIDLGSEVFYYDQPGVDYLDLTLLKPDVDVEAPSNEVEEDGGRLRFSLHTQTENAWTASSNKDWLKLARTQGHGRAVIAFLVEPNEASERTATITVTVENIVKTLTITQKATSVPVTYTVSYSLGGGSHGSNHPESGTCGTAFSVSAPSRTGYTFAGWTVTSGLNTSTAKWGASSSSLSSLTSSSMKCVNGATGSVYFKDLGSANGSVTLTANWTANSYGITYVLNSGTHGSNHPESGTYDTAFSVSAPSRAGYTFAGWTVTSGLNTSTAKWGTSSGSLSSLTSPSTKCVNGATGSVYFKNLTSTANGSVTLTANWTEDPKTYSVSYSLGGGSHGSNHPESGTCGTAFSVSAPSCTGYTFAGWTVTSGLNTSTAKWGANSSSLSSLTSSSTKCVNGATGSVYFKDLGSANGSVTLTANWTANSYGITYVLNSGTHGSNHPESGTYDTAFSVSAPSRAGYTFAGWTVTSGLNTSTAKWGTSSGSLSSLTSSLTKCMNGATGSVYFKNLTSTANGSVTLTANWTEACELLYMINNDSYAAVTGYVGKASTLIIPETLGGYPVEVIGGLAFMNNATIVDVTLPSSCQGVNSWAFYNCPNLRTVTYTYKVESFSSDFVYAYDDSFESCPSLTAVNVQGNVAIIPWNEESGVAMVAPFQRSNYVLAAWCATYGDLETAVDISVDGWLSSEGIVWSYWMAPTECMVTLAKGAGVESICYCVGDSGTWYPYSAPLSVTAGSVIQYYAVPMTGYTAVCPSTAPVRMIVSRTMTDELSATPNNYEINYVLNDGTHGLNHPENATYDMAFSVSAPTRSGYTFTGWTVTSGLNVSTAKWGLPSGECTTPIGSASIKCSNGASGDICFKNLTPDKDGEVTLTANWQENAEFVIENGTLVEYNGDGGDVIIPEGVMQIGKEAFFVNRSVESVTFPTSLTLIDEYAFYGCSSLKQVYFPEGLKAIGGWAFEDTGLTNVVIPDSVETIGDAAFNDCDELESIDLGEGVETLGYAVFGSCATLAEILIPASVTNIADRAFQFCDALRSVTFMGNAPSVGEALYAFDSDELVTYVQSGSVGWNGVGSTSLPVLWPVGDDDARAIQYQNVPVAEVTLSVVSEHGSPDPSVGTHNYAEGSKVTNIVESVQTEASGRTRYVCKGWTGTGSVPATGTSNGIVVEIREDSSIVWNWQTEHKLTINASENGMIKVATSGMLAATCWCQEGESKNLTATPNDGYVFDGWTGDTDGCTISGNKITVRMSKPRAIGATFRPEEVVVPEYGPFDPSEIDDRNLMPTFIIDAMVSVEGGLAKKNDVVAAYRMDNGALCGIGQLLDDTGFLIMVMYAPKDTKIHFKVWQATDEVSMDAVRDADSSCDIIAPEPGSDVENIEIKVSGMEDQTITLSGTGWHLISFCVEPEDNSPASVFAEVSSKISRVSCGVEYWIPGKAGTLSAISVGKAYWVQTKESDVSWTVTGFAKPETELALKAGWTLIGYVPTVAGSVTKVLKSALAKGVITRITRGVSYFIPGRTSSLTTMSPGEAFWVQASAATTIKFDAVSTPSLNSMVNGFALVGSALNATCPFVFDPEVSMGLEPTFIEDAPVSVYGKSVVAGDYVAVYRADTGKLCGMGPALDNSGLVTFVMYAPLGTQISFKIWKAAENKVYDVDASCNISAPDPNVGATGIPLTVTKSDVTPVEGVTIPRSEVEDVMTKYPALAAQAGNDPDAFAALPSVTGKLDANGNQMYVWQDIIAGTDPTNPDDKFKIVDIRFEDGELKVSWSPDLNENGTKNIRAYTEFGRKELGGSEKWTEMKDVDPAEKNDYKFRKVTVDMP